jgi:ferric-dicitrate binding protein FerR (iron transport regulator)
MNNETIIKAKILSYFNGGLSASGEAELFEWINKDPKNKDYFFDIKNELDPEKISHGLLTDSFLELRNKIIIRNQFQKKPIRKTRALYLKVSRIAAMLIFVVALSFSLAWMMGHLQQEKQEVAWFESSTPRGEKSKLQLPDGSTVWLNSESSISFPNNFSTGNREVRLSGEAYFEVEKLAGLPFIVKTEAYDIHVLGTKFNVMAYDDFMRTETSLIEGQVEIYKGSQVVALAPGQVLTYQDNKIKIKEANTIRSGYWKDGRFDFDQITLQELIVRLERWYDIDIKMENAELKEIVYSGVFKNEETIWQVLNSIQLTLPITYSRSGFREFEIERK